MNGKSKSILLQVAFKESAPQGGTVEEIENRTVQFYESLVSLHNKLGIDADDAPKSGKSYGGGASKSSAKEDPGTTFFYNDRIISDYREAKMAGKVKDRHPDFKPLDGQSLPGDNGNKNGAVWLIDQNGDPNEAAAELVAAADASS